ncbi:MAG: riboflavin synthase [Planctomycetota bacterium]|nr:riboflavin synthase [Planctomycetota bacterium]
MAEVIAVEPEGPGVRLTISAAKIANGTAIGDSIAINGCCLTVVSHDARQLVFQAGPETLSRTNLGLLQNGSLVNVERSLRVGDRLGGHYVTGHIDAVGHVAQRLDEQEWSTFWFSAPAEQMRQMASKGSIAVDGVSLTLVEVTADRFSVQLIPHTLRETTLGARKVNDPVNLETDLLAKYVARQLQSGTA